MRDLNGGALCRGEALVTVSEITSDWLAKQGACRSQLSKFVEVFGTSARVDSISYRLAVLNGFDLDWLSRKIFIGKTLLSYKQMWNRAERRRDKAISESWAALWSIVTSPVSTFEARDSAWRVHRNIRDTENARFRAAWMSFYRNLGFH